MRSSSVRVLHVMTRYLKRGGAEKNTLHTMRALNDIGVNTALLVGQGSQLDGLTEEPFPTIQSDHLVNRIAPVQDVQAICEISNLCQRESIDVVHTHQGKAGLIGRAAANLARVPVVIYGLHGDHMSHPRLNAISRFVYRLCEQALGRGTDQFVSVGKEIRQRYLNRGIGSPAQHTVIHSGMDLDPFIRAGHLGREAVKQKRKELGLEQVNGPVVGKVASLERRKGYDDAIEIVRRVVEYMDPDPVRFLFVGSGPERARFEKKIMELNLENEILFTGYRDDIEEVMACFDVFLFASHMEGLPQVLVQASACGLPIVSFDVEGAHEVVENGRTGYIVPDRNVGILTERLLSLLYEPETRSRFGNRARKQVDQRWSMDEMKRRVKSLYRRILKKTE